MTLLLAINTATAALAAVVNLWAAWRVRAQIITAVCAIRGTLAAMYATAMGAELLGPLGTLDRITIVQGLGLLAWPLVWILPGITIGKGYGSALQRVPEKVAEAIQQITQQATRNDEE